MNNSIFAKTAAAAVAAVLAVTVKNVLKFTAVLPTANMLPLYLM